MVSEQDMAANEVYQDVGSRITIYMYLFIVVFVLSFSCVFNVGELI